jgi:hypothetical protein
VITLARPEASMQFCAERAPALRCYADPLGNAYRAWGLKRGNAVELFGPAVWVETARASLKGEVNGKPAGDTFQMPGTFGVSRDGIVRYAHYSLHAGDYPVESRLMKAIEALATAGKQG